MTTFWIFSLCIHALVAMDTHPVSPSACSLSVSTNPGETVCQSGEQVNLNAFISGNFSSVEWTPQTGIANPFSPNTTATINGDITYTINVSGPDDLNLIVNGDFSAGVSGFTSDYAWPPTGGSFGPLSPEGQYQVTNNPNSQHANFAACGDATGDGNMMVVNGAGTPNVDVWCQNIGVSPFTDYEFSAWLASVVSGSPAQLQFSINGQLLGFFNASAATCNWQQFSQQWNSTGNSSATICIVNQNTATGGNDFALDGLSFAEVCTASADVTFTISECNATFFPFTDICINSFPFDLNSMLDPGATPGGSWTINGIPSDFFEPGVWGVGLHQVTYEVCDFPCPAIFSDFIVVEPLPDADWAAPPSICESEPVINLNTWLLPGSMSGGIWTINGIQSTTFNPAALGPGQHVITYTVGDPPCDNFLTDVVDVTSLANPSWTPPPPLCEDDAAFSLFDLTNLETTPNGTWLIEGVVNSTFNPALLGAGTYEVTYQAGIVPCDDSETHFITVSPTPNTEWTAPPPVCQSSAPFDLNTLLDPGAATGGTWTINGNTNNIFNPSALTPGNQFIQYFFNTGDCPSVTEGNIVVQFAPEAAFTLSEDTICIGQTTLQTFTGSENGMAVFNYDFDGAMVAGVGVNMRELSWNAPGTYQLSLWLEEGGCISDTVYANVVVLAPLATPIISCGDSTTSSVSFEWTSVAGATGYDVSLISGPPTGILNGNSITFDGLAPGESVSIQVSALSNGPCPPTISEVATCTTLNCIPPDVQITAVDPICLYDNILPFELEVTLNPTGGNGFWQGPGIVDSLLGIFDPMLADTGLHQIHYVYDLNNCLTSEAIFIEINPIPVLQLSGADTICISDSLNIMVLDVLLPGTLLNWDFAGGTSSDSVQSTVQTISWNTPGVKTITAQATLDGCSSDTALLIALVEPLLVAPLIECEASTNSVLFFWNPVANAASYSVTVNSGQSGVMTSDTSFLVTGLMPGEAVDIQLEISSNNACPAIGINQTCTAALCPVINVEISATDAVCLGELAHVEINIGGEDSGPYDLVLSINSINSFLESLENGYSADLLLSENTTFEILSLSNSQAPGCMIPLPTPVQTLVSTPVTAGNGVLPLSFCSRTDTLVELFDLLLGEDAGGAWTYISGPALGVNALTGSLFSPLSQAPGVYQFSYEITAAAPCPSDEAAVLVEMLERPFADAGADQTLSCLFNEATLGGNGTSTGPNFTYSWQTSSGHFSSATNTALVDVDAAGLYTLLVENTSNGCQDSDEVAVDSDISIPTAAFSITPITCFAANDGAIRIDSIQGGNAPYEILFNGDVFSSALFPMLEPGQYPITIIDAAGCQSAYTFDLSEPDEMQVVLLALFPGEDNEVELGDSLLLEILVNRPEEAIQQVIWQPADLGCDTCLSAVLYPSQSGLLSVEVIDLNGCSDSDQIQYFLRKDRNIYVPNIFSPNGDGANDVFLVFAGKEVRQINRFQVFSRWGEMVHESYNFLPNDPRFGWDGHYRGELMNAAVFVWYAEVELVDGKIVLLKGDVTLLK
ncbi:MAG TPA: gliding motility-associated C-terminal domain-containing protein [Saprospiraceae bacterium]|nr:gliding motility-associated C-terminal domain-containing protein [Saprospiraceae bacterium]HMQ83939.1 gliding motility-associated C-terminal domain-containing protein [Saprospiraceae bacterium]